jgi:phosphopantothenoylcysteine decarboxylase/phosphopantothenate--cysteine ligase
MLTGKNILLGVTGSIAAYKITGLITALKRLNAEVNVIMTKNATEIITPLTMERLSGNRCITETFDKNVQYSVKHIALAESADIVMLAPATANIIGKIANGIADDMLSTTIMACRCPVYIAPAMNTNMYTNPIVQDNIQRLKDFGYKIIDPAVGRLACGAVGAGKMPEAEVLLSYITNELAHEKDMLGKRVLVTAGATCEAIDPVRFITNHSTGKMGFAIASACARRGAEVTLVKAATTAKLPPFVEVVEALSAEDMFNEVTKRFDNCDIVIKSAAVADYTPVSVADEKMKKGDGELTIELKRTRDILKWLGEHKTHQYLCGFSMETQNMLENSRKKLAAKNADMIVANNLKVAGAGFGTDTNVATLITKSGVEELPIMSKEELADKILDGILGDFLFKK